MSRLLCAVHLTAGLDAFRAVQVPSNCTHFKVLGSFGCPAPAVSTGLLRQFIRALSNSGSATGRVSSGGLHLAVALASCPGRMQFRAEVRDGHWTETGTLTMPDRPTITTTRLVLRKKGNSDWPLGRPVDPTL